MTTPTELLRHAIAVLDSARIDEAEALSEMTALGSREAPPTDAEIDAAMTKANEAIHATIQARVALSALLLGKE